MHDVSGGAGELGSRALRSVCTKNMRSPCRGESEMSGRINSSSGSLRPKGTGTTALEALFRFLAVGETGSSLGKGERRWSFPPGRSALSFDIVRRAGMSIITRFSAGSAGNVVEVESGIG